MLQKCRDYGVKKTFIWALVFSLWMLEQEVHFVVFARSGFVDYRSIRGFSLYKDVYIF